MVVPVIKHRHSTNIYIFIRQDIGIQKYLIHYHLKEFGASSTRTTVNCFLVIEYVNRVQLTYEINLELTPAINSNMTSQAQ